MRDEQQGHDKSGDVPCGAHGGGGVVEGANGDGIEQVHCPDDVEKPGEGAREGFAAAEGGKGGEREEARQEIAIGGGIGKCFGERPRHDAGDEED